MSHVCMDSAIDAIGLAATHHAAPPTQNRQQVWYDAIAFD
jgi:hypothetical protein